MKCTCKLKEKLRIAKDKRSKYDEKCRRLNKIIANREGKKLRLVIWNYEGETTLYVKYTKHVEMNYDDTNDLAFFRHRSLSLTPCSQSTIDISLWQKEGAKVSKDIVNYYGKSYRLNKLGQLCEVKSTGIFKKVLHEIMIVDIVKELKS